MNLRAALPPGSMAKLRAGVRSRLGYNRRVVRRPPAKRQIRPHKGGRTESMPGSRVSAETLAAVRAVCAELDLTVGDWIEAHAHADSARLALLRATGREVDLEALLGISRPE